MTGTGSPTDEALSGLMFAIRRRWCLRWSRLLAFDPDFGALGVWSAEGFGNSICERPTGPSTGGQCVREFPQQWRVADQTEATPTRAASIVGHQRTWSHWFGQFPDKKNFEKWICKSGEREEPPEREKEERSIKESKFKTNQTPGT